MVKYIQGTVTEHGITEVFSGDTLLGVLKRSWSPSQVTELFREEDGHKEFITRIERRFGAGIVTDDGSIKVQRFYTCLLYTSPSPRDRS